MKIINLIIISILSLGLVACGGDDDKEKESKNKKEKEERGWETADKDSFLKNCTGDSSDKNLTEACDCVLDVAEDGFASYKEMLDFHLAEDADDSTRKAFEAKSLELEQAAYECMKDLMYYEDDWDESAIEAEEEAMAVEEWFPYEKEEFISDCVEESDYSYEACECFVDVYSENMDYDWFLEIIEDPESAYAEDLEYLKYIDELVAEMCSYLSE